jgi:polyisoprenoid-binding protein YceI
MGHLQVACLFALSIPPRLSAQEMVVDLDAAKTKIDFVLNDVLHTVHGTFRLKEGHVFFDLATGAMKGGIFVDATSGKSGNAIRDRRMTWNILEAKRYAEVQFVPFKLVGSIPATGTSTVEITGSFLIHGERHEITIPMELQMSQQEITATGKFIVPYVQWGMKNPSTFLLKVNQQVEIDLTAIGPVNGPRTP